MPDATSIRLMRKTRDALRLLADADGVTLDEEVQRLARAERQRRIGAALAAADPGDDDAGWLTLGIDTIGADARR